MYVYKTKLSKDNFLKNKENPLAKEYIKQIDEACNRYRNTPIEILNFSKFRLFDETGDRNVYQTVYFERRRKLLMLSLRVWLYGEKQDIVALEDIMWSVCDEYTWALPAHMPNILTDDSVSELRIDLFACETAHALAEIISLCGDVIHPKVVKRCINEILKRVLDVFESTRQDWEECVGNWAAVCGGAIGMTALYLIEDEERINQIINRVTTSCEYFVRASTDDGACLEGVTYWEYPMQYYIGFDELLRERLGRSGIVDEDKVKKMAAFPANVCFEGGLIACFADASHNPLLHYGILCKLNEKYNVQIPSYEYYTKIADDGARLCGSVRNIAWFNPEMIYGTGKREDIFYPLGNISVLTSQNTRFAIKGGYNLEPHNHNDVGSYIFIVDGKAVIDELGVPLYTREYFQETRYTIVPNASSLGHSLPIINGFGQSEGMDFKADAFDFLDGEIKVSFANAYDKKAGIKELVRYAYLDKERESLRIKDCFTFETNNNTVVDRIITRYDVKLLDEKLVVILDNNIIVAKVLFLCDGTVSISEGEYPMVKAQGIQKFRMVDITVNSDEPKFEIEYMVERS